MQQHFALSLGDIRNLVINGFKSAFIPFHEKAELLRQVNKEMDAVIARFASPASVEPRKTA